MMTERDNMLAGRPYVAADPELVEARAQARSLLRQYNATLQDEPDRRAALLRELLGHAGTNAWIEPPFFCDYGTYLFLGDGAFLNFNCVVLDCNHVRIGAGTMLGPAVQIYAATHDPDPAVRVLGPELAFPVTIGRNCWIGGGAIIGPGVTIGDNTTIGAGSVVTKDIPPNVIAVGNPCRVLRPAGGS
jgi:maltose O-acetyltransferase